MIAGFFSSRSMASARRASLAAGSACAFSARSTRSAILANCALAFLPLVSIAALSAMISELSCATTPRKLFVSGCSLAWRVRAAPASAPAAMPSVAATVIAAASSARRCRWVAGGVRLGAGIRRDAWPEGGLVGVHPRHFRRLDLGRFDFLRLARRDLGLRGCVGRNGRRGSSDQRRRVGLRRGVVGRGHGRSR